MRPRLITAENCRRSAPSRSPPYRFNEAAAHHRGEHCPNGKGNGDVSASMRPRLITAENQSETWTEKTAAMASMRPRLITAENGRQVDPRNGDIDASMRPRLITAENSVCTRTTSHVSCFNEAAAHHRGERYQPLPDAGWVLPASMRPRLITAENSPFSGLSRTGDAASMRPRLITAENGSYLIHDNEKGFGASMRPRLITAENPLRSPTRRGSRQCFNEAAAHHRGERRTFGLFSACSRSFNEAAAHHRGEHVGQRAKRVGELVASMRPRLITAENRQAQTSGCFMPTGFNEAAAHHRGERPALGAAASWIGKLQ